MRFRAAGEIGKVRQRRLASGAIGWWVDLRPHGRIFSLPDPGGGEPIPLRDRALAGHVLASIRAAIIDRGASIEAAMAPFLARPSDAMRFERRFAAYLEAFAARVEAGQRSPTTLRELTRYSSAEGHIGAFWTGRTIRDLTTANVDDFAAWLGQRPRGMRGNGTGDRLSPKTVRNVLTALAAFWTWLQRRGEVAGMDAPAWPRIAVPEYLPATLTPEQQARVLEAIPWDRRGGFLAAATEALRLGEIRACTLDDYLGHGRLRVSKAVQGNARNARIGGTKNRSASVRDLWSEELVKWIEWRVGEVTPERRLRGETALFFCPTARHAAKRWSPDAFEREWHRACLAAGVGRIRMAEGTRHSTLTELSEWLPERMLRAFSRHRDARSLDHYARTRARPAAIVSALSAAKAARDSSRS